MDEPGAATAAGRPTPTLDEPPPSVPIYKLPNAEAHRVKRGSTPPPELVNFRAVRGRSGCSGGRRLTRYSSVGGLFGGLDVWTTDAATW